MKAKKVTKQRASKTHGWGSKKKHRGAGNRGGRGNAGSGKRGDQKKPAYWNPNKPVDQKRGKSYFGKHGFFSVTGKDVKALNVRYLDTQVVAWAAEKKVSKSGDVFIVDLKALGYGKLLGTGKITKKIKVTVAAATPSAIEKVNAAGGSITLTKAAEESEESTEDEE
jgi:large subunit ribosomal protein L15